MKMNGIKIIKRRIVNVFINNTILIGRCVGYDKISVTLGWHTDCNGTRALAK
jgi:hypothetical protein